MSRQHLDPSERYAAENDPEANVDPRQDRPTVKLVGADGNAFMVLGLASRAAKKAGWTQERIDAYKQQATAGDYDNLLAVTMEMFDVQ